MPNVAPGKRSSTAWASTWGVEVVVEGGPDLLQRGVAVANGVALTRRAPRVETGGGDRHHRFGPVPVVAVVVGEHRQADGLRLPLLQQVAHEHQVAERLR